MSYHPSAHYDRVTAAWGLLLGDELHYGVFTRESEDLEVATAELTRLMLEAARILPGNRVLDVGCGTGAPACRLALERQANVTAISTSATGIDAARERVAAMHADHLVKCEQRDGTANGYPDASFDRIWALESSHLMPKRDRLLSECARVLNHGGRLALCDIMLRRPMDLMEVRRLREPLSLLRAVFGEARMEPASEYRRLAESAGLEVDVEMDLTEATRPTFGRWRANAERHRESVNELIGDAERERFVESCAVLEGFWDDGTLGYALMAAVKP